MQVMKINNKGAEISYKPMVDECTFSEDGDRIVCEYASHGLSDNDAVMFFADDGADMKENAKVEVDLIDKDHFVFNKFPDIALEIGSYDRTDVRYRYGEDEKDTLRLFLSRPVYYSKHFIPQNVRESVYDDYYEVLADVVYNRCYGDFFTYNDVFLYCAEDFIDGMYDLSTARLVNSNDIEIYFEYDNSFGELIEFINSEDFVETEEDNIFVDRDNNRVYLRNINLPCLLNGRDDKSMLLWSPSDTVVDKWFIEFLTNENETLMTSAFFIKDERFIYEVGDGVYSLSDYVTMTKETGHFKVMFPFSQDFALDMDRDEEYEEFFIKEKQEESVNKIVDFEKFMFEPVYDDNGEYRKVREIRINPHFKYREDKDEWLVGNGSGYDFDRYINKSALINTGDIAWSLGFDDEDIYYRKRRVKKSFIRISVYDTPNRTTQNLLFYSTVFLDNSELYQKYMNRLAKDNYNKPNNNPNEYTSSSEGTEDDILAVSFIINDKYDYSKCSEGFYLYLFNDTTNGLEERELYMKLEFNNAKYGTTVPLFLQSEDGKVLNYNDEGFKKTYVKGLTESGDTVTVGDIDLAGVLDDMYIRIKVAYNKDLDCYTWRIPLEGVVSEDGRMTLNVWEPNLDPIFE